MKDTGRGTSLSYLGFIRHAAEIYHLKSDEMSDAKPGRMNWSYPTAVKFGPGRISELADHCKAVGLKKPLLVTDKALASLPITARALDILEARRAGPGGVLGGRSEPERGEHGGGPRRLSRGGP